MSWTVDTHGHVFQDRQDSSDDYAHVVLDGDGVEWSVREILTPQVWARGPNCLVLSSRECVRRVWSYPRDWRELDAETLLRLGRAD